MFDRISPNDRILTSRFGQAIIHLACTVSGAEDTRQRMKTCIAPLPRKIFCYQEMRKTSGSCVELSAPRFWAEYSDKRPSAQYLRPNIQPIYQEKRSMHAPFPNQRVFLLFADLMSDFKRDLSWCGCRACDLSSSPLTPSCHQRFSVVYTVCLLTGKYAAMEATDQPEAGSCTRL